MGLFSSAAASHVPVVSGRRLDGSDVRLPHDLPADATLLIVSFRDDLDAVSDQWARLGERIREHHGDRFAVWETPIVNGILKPLGDLGTIGLRHNVDSDEERDRTIPLYTDVKAFRKTLKLKSGDVYPILVARDGRIAWRGEGDIDMDEVAALEEAVADVLAAPVPEPTDHPDVELEEESAEPNGDAEGAPAPLDEPESDEPSDPAPDPDARADG